MTPHTLPATVTITRRFSAPPRRVFEAWTDPKVVRQWMFATPAGRMGRVEVDARAGGGFVVVEERGGDMAEHHGRYLEFLPPQRLVFELSPTADFEKYSRVTIEIRPDGAGSMLTLRHDMPAEFASWTEKAKEGWTKMLHGLALVSDVEDEPFGAPVDATSVRIERLLPGPAERLWSYLVDPQKRALWLAGGTAMGAASIPVELRFRHADLSPEKETPPRFSGMEEGCSIVGTVLDYDPPRRLAYTWTEPSAGHASEVSFELSPVGDKVRLVVVHARLGTHAEKISVAAGWHAHLGILADVLAGREPRPFWSTHAVAERVYDARLQQS